ncbi:hypothetical protein THERMOT_1004 [Bathymodiolus thermophilus thioautotrophic gill symbiont]|nr:hypothetical protein THERMOT_1004 [Bathymodiolus thermophilus thioautotrophic gill symbiont]
MSTWQFFKPNHNLVKAKFKVQFSRRATFEFGSSFIFTKKPA